MTDDVTRLVVCCTVMLCIVSGLTWAGDCLDTREKMLADLKAGIEYSIANPESEKVNLGPWINHCWNASRYNEDEAFDDELAEIVLWTLHHPCVPVDTIERVLKIANKAAPRALFSDILSMLKEDEIEDTELSTDIILNIWGRYSRKDSIVASLDFYDFLKNYKPSAFDNESEKSIYSLTSLHKIHYALSWAYPNDYPAARGLLIQWGLLGHPSYGISLFNDPRAWEDANYPNLDSGNKSLQNSFFYSLTGHLELEFKPEWIRKLPTHQQVLLRNGILATYGYKFKGAKLRSFFATGMSKFCRNGKCGVFSDTYDDSLLTDVDQMNIKLIQQIERERR